MEKVPRKKEKKRLKKGAAMILLLSLILLAGAGVYFVRRPQTPALPETPEALGLLRRAAEEISAIAVAPAEGLSYPLVRAEGGFVLMGREDVALRQGVVEEILEVASTLEAEKEIVNTAEHAVRLSDYGLEPPGVRVIITYRDGEKKELRIGAEAPDETPQRYCMVSGDSHIYTALASQCDAFAYELDYLRSFDQPELDAALLDRIDIEGQITFGAYYTPSGWIMDQPYRYPLAVKQMEATLSRISAMAFEACLGEEKEMNLADYGLDQPVMTITLTQAETVITGETAGGEQVRIPVPETKYTLRLGNETGKSGVYLLWMGRVYKASNFLLGFWKEWSADALLLREPVNLMINDLRRVSLEADGRSAAYEVRMVESVAENNQIAIDEYGNILYDCAVWRAGEQTDMDAEAFLSWYTDLASVSPAGRVPEGYVPEGKIRARITLESGSLTREITFTPYDALHDAMAVDGVCVFYVDGGWLEKAKQTP